MAFSNRTLLQALSNEISGAGVQPLTRYQLTQTGEPLLYNRIFILLVQTSQALPCCSRLNIEHLDYYCCVLSVTDN